MALLYGMIVIVSAKSSVHAQPLCSAINALARFFAGLEGVFDTAPSMQLDQESSISAKDCVEGYNPSSIAGKVRPNRADGFVRPV
jgi:hypothetical protein